MSSFNGLDLFSSGSHRFEIGGVGLRYALHETPGSRGAAITGQGQNTRRILQAGELAADTVSALRGLISAVEQMLDGQAYVLVDNHGASWPNTVMIEFKPSRTVQTGPRYWVSYRVHYLQLTPQCS